MQFRYGVALIDQSSDSHFGPEEAESIVKSGLESSQFDKTLLVSTDGSSGDVEEVAAAYGARYVGLSELADLLIEFEVGVSAQGGQSEFDAQFWELFRGQTRTGSIDTLEIPQADSFARLRQTLTAIAEGNHHKKAISAAISEMAGEEFRDRQADYYATAAWLLGFTHKAGAGENVATRGRWGLTRLGQSYINAAQQGDETTAQSILHRQIREVEIVRRILLELGSSGDMSRDELISFVASESDLSGTTVGRRVQTIASWMSILPEVTYKTGGSYLGTSGESAETVALSEDELRKQGAVFERTPAEGDETAQKTDNEILDDIMGSFEAAD
jgi:hypothetical protein